MVQRASQITENRIERNHRDSHQLAISMSVRPRALLEAALRRKERAVENRSHGKHATHDGTCSIGGHVSDARHRQVKKQGGAYDVKKCAKDWRVSRCATRIGEIS